MQSCCDNKRYFFAKENFIATAMACLIEASSKFEVKAAKRMTRRSTQRPSQRLSKCGKWSLVCFVVAGNSNEKVHNISAIRTELS
jgi:hypothetical protein